MNEKTAELIVDELNKERELYKVQLETRDSNSYSTTNQIDFLRLKIKTIIDAVAQ